MNMNKGPKLSAVCNVHVSNSQKIMSVCRLKVMIRLTSPMQMC